MAETSQPVTKHVLLKLLHVHAGASMGIGSAEIAQLLGWSTRQVRDLVTELRMDGIAVCGHPSTGYYIARTPEELEQTLKFLRDRAITSLTIESRLRKVPLADLLGQLKLPT